MTTTSGFDGLGIAPKLMEVLDRSKFTTPTPIQQKAIPLGLEGKDVIGIAQTGTGKTLAFGIPMIQVLARIKGQGLVLVPTRELALQVDENLQKVGKGIGLRTAVLIGGAPMGGQIASLKRHPNIIIATPGRLIDHLERKSIDLSRVKALVLDEADRMLDMGFAPQIKKILEAIPKERQTMLFSATMPAEIVTIANSYMKLPTRVEVAPAGTASERVAQELFFVRKDNKPKLLAKLLTEYRGSVLVFSRTKYGATKIAKALRDADHTASEIHSNRTLGQRRNALDGFKSGKYRVLVATDIAARGIDVKGIELVVNYDLPENPEDYVHRIGRTGRAGHEGRAISFATPDQKQEVVRIERLIRASLKVSQHPDLPAEEAIKMDTRDERGSSRGRFAGRGRSQGRGRGERREYNSRSEDRPERGSREGTRSRGGNRFERSAQGSDSQQRSDRGRSRDGGSRSAGRGSKSPFGQNRGRGKKDMKRTFIDFRDKTF